MLDFIYCLLKTTLMLVIPGQVAHSHTLLLLQTVSLIVEAVTWCSMLVMLSLETKVYIYEFRWFIRFGVIYALIGDAVMLNLVLSLKDFYNRCIFLFSWIHFFGLKRLKKNILVQKESTNYMRECLFP